MVSKAINIQERKEESKPANLPSITELRSNNNTTKSYSQLKIRVLKQKIKKICYVLTHVYIHLNGSQGCHDNSVAPPFRHSAHLTQ